MVITTASVCFYSTPTFAPKPSLQNYSEVFQKIIVNTCKHFFLVSYTDEKLLFYEINFDF